MTCGEIFSGAAACCAILCCGIRAWKQRDIGWNRRRAVLRFFLTAVNVLVLLAARVSGNFLLIGAFYMVLVISALGILCQEWHCRKNNM